MQHQKKEALLLLVDFQKAFDSIDHTFIDNALKLYGFGESIRMWIRLFFDKREALILLGGHLSEKIILEQGVPQGDVISPYIFNTGLAIARPMFWKPGCNRMCVWLCI